MYPFYYNIKKVMILLASKIKRQVKGMQTNDERGCEWKMK